MLAQFQESCITKSKDESMGSEVLKWQNKHHRWRRLGPSNHFTNCGQCWTSKCCGSRLKLFRLCQFVWRNNM